MKGDPSIAFNHHPIPARFLGPVEGIVSTFESISPLIDKSTYRIGKNMKKAVG
ncbi:MAG: hypothetical protein AB2535_07755 [Candidatus Thiodiazotropha endolucinida]